MKPTLAISLPVSCFILSSVFCPLTCVKAQGQLNPPGTPAPTMKSLDQIEARTPISTAPFTISGPGSYYLTKNLNVTSGPVIIISTGGGPPSRDITLDLNGFTISSTASNPSDYAIGITAPADDITILNGHIQGYVSYNGSSYSGAGFLTGITHFGTAISNVRVVGVTVTGCLSDGINLGGNSTVVQNCTVSTVGGYGIVANSVSDSSADNCGQYGISATVVQNCYGFANGSGTGVSATTVSNSRGGSGGSGDGVDASSAINCYGLSNTGHGVSATNAANCYGASTSGRGVNSSVAQSCYGTTSSGTGVYATFAATNCYGTASSSGAGIFAGTATNCYGSGNGGGISCNSASNCYGISGGSTNGLTATQSAMGCYGSSSTGFGLEAKVAAFCWGDTASSAATVSLFANSIAFACGANRGFVGHQYFCGTGANPYP